MAPLLRAPCGKTRNSRNKLFTAQALRDHLRSCPVCNPERFALPQEDWTGCEDNPINDMDTSDMSDGAFFATLSWFDGDW